MSNKIRLNICWLNDADKDVLLANNYELESVFEHFNCDMVRHREYVAAIDDTGRIVGLIGLTKTTYHLANAYGLAFFDTHPQFRNMGIATQMVPQLLDFCKIANKNLRITPWTDDGEKYLKPIFLKQLDLKKPNIIVMFPN